MHPSLSISRAHREPHPEPDDDPMPDKSPSPDKDPEPHPDPTKIHWRLPRKI